MLIPLVFLPLMAFLIGMSWFLCAVGAFTRDAGYLMINIVPLFMFATPVFYPAQLAVAAVRHPDLRQCADRLCRGACATSCCWARCPIPLVYLLDAGRPRSSTFYFGYWFFDRYRNVIVDVI